MNFVIKIFNSPNAENFGAHLRCKEGILIFARAKRSDNLELFLEESQAD